MDEVFGVVPSNNQHTHDMKLKKAFIHGFSILSLTCLASAQDAPKGPPPEGGRPPGDRPQGGPPGGGDPAARLAEFIKRADSDGDGKISKDEFMATPGAKKDAAKAGESFTKKDKNSDGFLSKEEMAPAKKKKK